MNKHYYPGKVEPAKTIYKFDEDELLKILKHRITEVGELSIYIQGRDAGCKKPFVQVICKHHI